MWQRQKLAQPVLFGLATRLYCHLVISATPHATNRKDEKIHEPVRPLAFHPGSFHTRKMLDNTSREFL